MTKQALPEGVARFRGMGYGMFIHWGLYSILGRGEWVMHNEQIPVAEYELLAQQFNPLQFNADEWVRIAADAGQKYVVLTSRHHDGFSMYDTKLSDYKVTKTPFKRDVLGELANACARRGDVKLGVYSSVLDWHHPAYRFRRESHMAWSDYVDFLHGQVRELFTNYGEIVYVWFDGDWPRDPVDPTKAYFAAGGSFEYDTLYNMIHTLQPDALIHNNRHDKPLPGEDIQGIERDLPGENTVGFNTTQLYDLPIEVAMTINNNWGFNPTDHDDKSVAQLLDIRKRCIALGANLMINVGPDGLGVIPAGHSAILHELREKFEQE